MDDSTGLGLLQKLIEPHSAVADAPQRRMTRALASLMLALLVLNAAGAAIYFALTGSFPLEALGGEVIFLAVYGLSRGSRPIWGAVLLGISTSALVFVSLPTSDYPAPYLSWTLLPILLAAMTLPLWAAIALALLNLAGAVMFAALSTAVPTGAAAISLLVIVFVSLIVLTTKVLRDRDTKVLDKQAQDLDSSRARYQRLFDDVPVGLYQTTPSGQIVDVNAACLELLGFASQEALLASNTRDLYVEADRRQQWKRILEREGAVHRFESQMRRPDGRTIWVRESAQTVRDETGQVVSYTGNLEDITERRRAETALRESEERFRTLAGAAPDAIVVMDDAGSISYWNSAAEKMFDYAEQDAMGKSLHTLVAPERYRSAYERGFARFQQSGQGPAIGNTLELSALRRDGSEFPVELSLSAIRRENRWHAVGIIRDVTTRKQTESQREAAREALRESEKKYRSYIDNAPDGVFLVDERGNFLEVNDAACGTTGYSAKELLSMGIPDLTAPEALEEAMGTFAQVAQRGKSSGEIPVITKDGSRRHWSIDAVRLSDMQVLGFTKDITARVQARERLEQRNLELATLNALAQALSSSLELDDLLGEALLRTVLTLGFAGGSISLADERTDELVLANYTGLPLPLVERLQVTGLDGTLGDYVYRKGKPLYLSDLDGDLAVDVRGLADAGLQSYAGTPIVHQDRTLGALCLFDATPHPVSETERLLLTTIGQQIGVAVENARLFRETQERVGELELLHKVSLAAALGAHLEETQQAAAEALVAAMPDARVALLLLGPENRALSVRASVGYDVDALQGVRIGLGEGIVGWVAEHGQPLLVPDVRQDPRYLEIATDIRSELCVPLKAGSQVIGVLNVESSRANAFTHNDRRLLSALANNLALLIERAHLFEQVEAARVELQTRAEELAKANDRLQELDRLKSEFLANMSHELRTPLNAILGFTQLMQRSSSFPTDHRENLEIIGRSGEHLLGLINDVLDISKIEAGRATFNPASFDLHRMLDSLKAMIAVRVEEKGLQLELCRAHNVPQFVTTDERKLRQVLTNLLSNAVKFTEVGCITVRVRHSDEEATSSSESGCVLHFEVEDSGAGIAAEEMDTLFESFTQTESGRKAQQGTGLGLPISRKFVEMMGGDLTVSSQVGRGSTFEFDVQVELADMADVDAGQVTQRVIGLEPNQPHYRILVVDDRVENRMLIRQLLEPVGFGVEEAVNGREAVDLHESWQPHAIFMDMRMPVMDGYEASQRIKATVQGQSTAIIALTASALEEEKSVILSSGCDAYLRKPFREADVFAELAQHLGVRYVYDDLATAQEESGKAQFVLTPEALMALPSEWIAGLHDAASKARGDLILPLLAQIEHDHAPLAKTLAQLVHEFQFDQIVSLVERQKGV